MAEKKEQPVDTVIAKQNEATSVLSAAEKKAVLARRLKAVQGSTHNTAKMRRAIDRLAANINK